MKYFVSVMLLLVVMASCKSKKETPDKKPDGPVLVDAIVAEGQPISNNLEVNGTVVANEYVEMHPEVSGRLTYLNVPEGSYVRQGALLARLYDADLQAQIAKSKVALELAIKTEERLKKLFNISGVNQADYDAAVNAVNSNRADIAYTQALVTKTYIKAPFSGTLGLRQISPGAFVTPATVIATIQQMSKLKIDFTLPEEYSNIIKRGAVVNVQLDASSDARTQATIIATEPKVDVNTRNLKVRAVLGDNTSNAGAFVKVFINTTQNASAIMVPTNCIIPSDINKQLIVVRKGKASFVNVETGIRQANNVQITKGVNIGDTVVVTGVLFARPNSQLKVRSIKKMDNGINDIKQ